jgi:hypothetical protein
MGMAILALSATEQFTLRGAIEFFVSNSAPSDLSSFQPTRDLTFSLFHLHAPGLHVEHLASRPTSSSGSLPPCHPGSWSIDSLFVGLGSGADEPSIDHPKLRRVDGRFGPEGT